MALMTADGTKEAIGADQLVKEVLGHVRQLRRGLQRMLTELGSPRTPTQLKQQLGVGYTVCWQLFQVVRDETADTQHVPSVVAIKRFLIAAQEHGLTGATADAVLAAADSLHEYMRQHAQDRDYFDAMVAGGAAAANGQGESKGHVVTLQRRKAAHRANSHIWGSQNDMWLVTNMVRRNQDDPTKIDSMVLSRQQGLRRLRADATVYLMAMKLDNNQNKPDSEQDDPVKHALDRRAAQLTGMPLLPEFSTNPLPQVRSITTASGRRQFNWVDDAVGLQSSCDIVTGTINHGIPMVDDGDGKKQVVITSTVRNKTSALLVLDLIVHRESFPKANVQWLIHEAMNDGCSLEEAKAGHQFATKEGAQRLGRADVVNLAEFPQYRSLLEHASKQAGWSLAEFDVHRLHVPYPIMGAVHRLYFFDNG